MPQKTPKHPPELLRLLKTHGQTERLKAQTESLLLVQAYLNQAKRLERQTRKQKNLAIHNLVHATVHNVLLDLLKQMAKT